MKSKPDEKGDNDDALKQSNKSHKGMREKLKKRRKQEKEIKKKKKEKKKEAKLKELKKQARKERKEKKREDQDSDDDSDKEDSKLLKYIKKLKIFMEEEADDLFEMFETLDAGGEVMIEELENGKVKNYLKKIFKYFGLKKNSETNEFSKSPDITVNLKKTFQDLWYQGVDTDSEDSDDDKKKGKMEEEEEEDEEEQEKKKELTEEEVAKAKNALLEGIKQLPHDAPKEVAADDEPKRIKGEEWRSFLDEKFGSIVGEDKKGYSKLASKAGGASGEDRTDRDKKIDEFMTDYNSQFRKKSLMEEHQERKRNAAMGKPVERRAFDREMDVNMSRIDSKKVFQMINSKDNNLASKFGHSQSGNKYL